MKKELIITNQMANTEELREFFHQSIQEEIYLGIPSSLIYLDEVSKYANLIGIIDMPWGLAHTDIKKEECAFFAKRGVKILDICFSNIYINEMYLDRITKEIRACLSVVKKYDVEIRAVTDYFLCDKVAFRHFSDILKNHGITKLSLNTGVYPRPMDDLMLDCYEISSDFGLLPITCNANLSDKYKKGLVLNNVYANKFLSTKYLTNTKCV